MVRDAREKVRAIFFAQTEGKFVRSGALHPSEFDESTWLIIIAKTRRSECFRALNAVIYF
jgi:hypothetical protein